MINRKKRKKEGIYKVKGNNFRQNANDKFKSINLIIKSQESKAHKEIVKTKRKK